MNKRTLLYIAAAAVLAFAWYRYRMPRFVAGEKAPDITLTTVNGVESKLSDLQGKFVLLQFWGSWCGPCRAENPHLVELYKKYHDQGFEIVSLGVESNVFNWQRAIQQDQMVWPYHSTDLKMFEGAIPKIFNVKSIPTTFLLNREGVIMGVSLDPDQIDKRLSTALTK
jgi:thiol-disulfide isomerase/thioredoxin